MSAFLRLLLLLDRRSYRNVTENRGTTMDTFDAKERGSRLSGNRNLTCRQPRVNSTEISRNHEWPD